MHNLGNTCYMNSAIQCLNACLPLSSHLLSYSFVKDINQDNFMGCNGRLAAQYARLIRIVYSGSNQSFTPSDVRQVVAHFQQSSSSSSSSSSALSTLFSSLYSTSSSFSSSSQQDAQEWLNVTMDRMHEDLNLIKKKPYVDNLNLSIEREFVDYNEDDEEQDQEQEYQEKEKDSKMNKDKLINFQQINKEQNDQNIHRLSAAQESWRRHQLRNVSVMNDLFCV
ncbi:MAG: putative ubiquitin carboxyl-terminal hydrolase [Streblomastix strix]|uniref:Putative ubiquitin carboxyl-terminal hydrolase n=1 Tax=Streblomastix strix TaxID=222440 RepID=A0A5J4VYR2_9EUKA|nr:MAG: putative ubiquitin carboxyl-terminal hydrolase [Streblomastix strix]